MWKVLTGLLLSTQQTSPHITPTYVNLRSTKYSRRLSRVNRFVLATARVPITFVYLGRRRRMCSRRVSVVISISNVRTANTQEKKNATQHNNHLPYAKHTAHAMTSAVRTNSTRNRTESRDRAFVLSIGVIFCLAVNIFGWKSKPSCAW